MRQFNKKINENGTNCNATKIVTDVANFCIATLLHSEARPFWASVRVCWEGERRGSGNKGKPLNANKNND